jgi:hypothetical protein
MTSVACVFGCLERCSILLTFRTFHTVAGLWRANHAICLSMFLLAMCRF